MELSNYELIYFQRAIALARLADENHNLPIGAVITLRGEIIAEGKNTIWSPERSLWRHAEMEALQAIPVRLRGETHEMSLFTTLEPCLMCAGAILLHGIGRVLFGSEDPYGGASSALDTLPPFFMAQMSGTQWIGPILPELCDPLYERVKELENR
jgi:tRNA(adenine34) deaminase